MPKIHEDTKSEYRVRPITRYVATRFRNSEATNCCGSESLGEFDNAGQAYAVAYALAREEARNRDLPPADERVMYPQEPAQEQSSA